MRSSASHHKESIRAHASHFWPSRNHAHFRPSLNIQELSNLLLITKDSGINHKKGKGKRRAAEAPVRASKRARTPSGSVQRGESESSRHSESTGLDDFVWPDALYPDVSESADIIDQFEGLEVVPVYQHTFEIHYTTKPPPEQAAIDDEDELYGQWELKENNLRVILASMRRSPDEPKTIDLGEVHFVEFHGRLVVVSLPLENRVGRGAWLMLLPSLNEDFDLAWHDMSTPAVGDLMLAWHILKSADRATIKTHLKMILLPSSDVNIEDHELPFRLELVSDLSIVIPSIFEPPLKKQAVEVQDAQRRIFDDLYPPSVRTPESFGGIINIPYFYSALRPAPPLQLPSLQALMQPEELNPTLLPFQRRSVAWLLDREGKSMNPDGTIVPKAESDDFALWERIEEGNYTLYLNRLSGTLSPTPPQAEPVFGGILAEEPGLGKTLEIIALILMNPAPERGPAILRWDPVAKLEIKAIKSTLIVTPPSLASQWADELTAHAPSLKVLMYDGWTKVPVPISRTQIEAERLKLKKAKAKALKKTGKAGSITKPKKSKNTAKGKKKYDEDEDAMDVDEPDNDDSDEIEIIDWCQYVNSFDVVITTYSVLKTDFNVARAAPERPRREDVVYSNVERPRSPLIMVEWNRVVMDEVQMVGGGKAEDMVSLIPRVSSFAVSGTPARAQVSDLMHILKFLRIDAIVDSPRLWKRMISSGCGAGYFATLFEKYAIRTLKANVKDELTIPQQTRFLVNISMGPVEKHVYDQAVEAVLLDLGLDARGVAASGGWQVDGALLRSSIRRLRGICTHPQVGQLQRTGDKFYKPGAVKTIEDVLQNMRDQNWRDMMDDVKAKVNTIITAAQYQQRDERDLNRYQHALATLMQAEKEATALTEEVKNALSEHSAKGAILKKEASAATLEGEQSMDKGKERQRDVSEASTHESGDSDLPHSPAADEHGKKRGALQNRLRECRLILHRVKFLQGDLYHILGSSHSPSEDAAYAAAEEIRRGLLKGTEEDARRAMAQLAQDATKKNITQEALMLAVPFLDDAGFLSLITKYEPTDEELKLKPVPQKVTLYKRAGASQELVEEVNEIIDDVLNEQSSLLWEWRNAITSLLTQKLTPGEDEADGEEYQRTLDNQGEAETYLQSYSAVLADRRQALINERTLLAAHDVREKKLRHTKAAIKAAAAADARLEITDDIELQPEHEVLHTQLSAKRKELLERLGGRAVKSILIDLNTAAARINKDGDPEKALLKDAVAALRQLITDQGTLLDKLDADLALIRKAFNQRILYFRQLQEISDSVTEISWENTLEIALAESLVERKELEAKINTTRARQRYLEHLAKNKDDGVADEDEESCILCRCEFTRGFITQCAHVFCEGCMKAWLLRKEGKTCPVCRVPIDPDTIQRFTVNQPEEEPAPKAMPNSEPAPKSRRKIAYNMIDPELLNEIQSTGSFGDFGTKIQTLVRHILYLQMADPGGKSIIFSAWADSLHIMERALRDNGIPCLRIDQKSKGESAAKRFKSNPDILVLLLHGERENAGLNITCASRVFLLESVVHHGFEIQAIARIDRMGQTRPTEVYCYYAEDTVERNILDLAARQGLSLYTKENSAGTLNVSSLGMDAETKTVDSPVKKVQKGDFIFKIDDMLAILFPHMYEDVEYLLPSEDVEMANGEAPEPVANGDSIRRTSRNIESNAIAGPSRLS